MNEFPVNALSSIRTYFHTGVTHSYAFRRKQLQLLKQAIYKYETELHSALYTDLKKNAEESWVTETGFVIAEVNHTLKHLHQWMKPKKVPTNLLNFPSKSYIYHEPLGVVLIIGPWNYPLQLLFAPLVGAIAAGNCVIVKPSEYARATAAVMEKIIGEIFPKNYVLLVPGDGSEIVPYMMSNFRFDHVFFTGSISVGKKVYEMAATQLVPVTLELGGKSPCVVESDADIKVAARRIAQTKFSNAGQMCVAPDYVLVHISVKETFVSAMKETIQQFYSADASDNYNYGKIINDRQFNRIINYLQYGSILYGGRYDAKTHYIEPALIADIPPGAVIRSEEIFGPVLPLFSFDTFEEAKAIIDCNPNPLAFYVFTQSDKKAQKWVERIPFGGGCINNASWHLTNFNLPFGGRGNSGIGAYHGRFSFDTFSHQKAVMKTPAWFDPKIKYPPFKGKLNWFKRIIK